MPQHRITIDLSWSVAEIEACLLAFEQRQDPEAPCAHPWTVPLEHGTYCVSCEAMLPDDPED